jgi:hypothetical protein
VVAVTDDAEPLRIRGTVCDRCDEPFLFAFRGAVPERCDDCRGERGRQVGLEGWS